MSRDTEQVITFLWLQITSKVHTDEGVEITKMLRNQRTYLKVANISQIIKLYVYGIILLTLYNQQGHRLS